MDQALHVGLATLSILTLYLLAPATLTWFSFSETEACGVLEAWSPFSSPVQPSASAQGPRPQRHLLSPPD